MVGEAGDEQGSCNVRDLEWANFSRQWEEAARGSAPF